MKIIAKIIRVITVAPIMALIMLLTLFINNPDLFGSTAVFILSIIFLTVFPLLGYPLQPLIKKYKDKGREGQRTLAIIFAVAGYICGCLSAIIMNAPTNVWIIYLSYLFSGALVMLINKACHFKASGHTCGIVGPFAILLYFNQTLAFVGIPILALAWFSSIKIKRHTNLQLIGGAIIPIVGLGLSVMLCSVL